MKSLPSLSVSLSLFICIALICAAPACAQTGGGIVVGNGATAGVVTVQGTVGTQGGVLQGLKGVPFSADVVNETNRVLADGNRIHQETPGKIFRDSEGRTRDESEFELGGGGEKQVRVLIFDPVQQVFISLSPQTKSATVQHLRPPVPARPEGVTSKPPAQAQAVPQQHTSVKTEQLGTKEIEGFTVTGKRTSITTEAGTIGNEKPLVRVTESWMSRDLGRPLLTITDDPQSGQRITRLTNIQTGDPDPLLFQVPSDYTVKDNQ